VRGGLRSSILCDRVRGQISLDLDGELSQLERRMVAAHLERCPECSAFRADVSAFTDELRSAEPETLTHPIVISRRRRAVFARVQAGVAAAVAVVALGTVAQVTGSRSERSTFRSPERFATYTQLAREVEQIVADARAFEHSQGEQLPI
jgi:predicted anti-sigma-YlaC factor YlaD